MFSKLSAERFEQERKTVVGPGYYRVPTNFAEGGGDSPAESFQVYEENIMPAEKLNMSKSQGSLRTPRRKPGLTTASNRVLLGQPSPREGEEVDQLRRRLQSAEAFVGDAAVAKKSATRAHAQMLTKERQMEELKRQLEDLQMHHAKAMQRTTELETERNTHSRLLRDKDNTIAALQRSIHHSKAQLEDRNRRPEAQDLAATRELVKEQASRLEQQDAELLNRTQELEASNQQLDKFAVRFTEQIASTEEQLRQLTKSQERIHSNLLDREFEALMRSRSLEEKLKEERSSGVQVVSQLVVRQASLDATLAMLASEEKARKAAEARAAEAEARASALSLELEAARGEAQAAKELLGQEQQARLQLGSDLAAMRGRLFLAEEARRMLQAEQQRLKEALSAVEEAAKVQEEAQKETPAKEQPAQDQQPAKGEELAREAAQEEGPGQAAEEIPIPEEEDEPLEAREEVGPAEAAPSPQEEELGDRAEPGKPAPTEFEDAERGQQGRADEFEGSQPAVEEVSSQEADEADGETAEMHAELEGVAESPVGC